MLQRMKWSVVVLLGLTGCTSTSLIVNIDPPSTGMRTVSVDGRTAELVAAGQYRGSVSAEKGQKREVEVVATSADGVEATEMANVFGGSTTSTTLVLPAEVHATVRSGRASEVRIDGDLIEPEDGVYKRTFQPGTGQLSVEITGRGTEGARDEDVVVLRAGDRAEVILEFGLSAHFSMSHTDVFCGEEMTFDASSSSPSRSIVSYRWDFGDGTQQTHDEPIATHTYAFDPARGEDTQYVVKLEIVNRDGLTAGMSDSVQVALDRVPLQVDLAVFPSHRNWYHPGEPLQLTLTPREGFKPDSLADVVIDFGDGSRRRLLPPGAPVTLDCEDDGCPPLVVEHSYAAPGLYVPTLIYSHGTEGLEGPYEATIRGAKGPEPELAVVPVYQTPKQLEDAAWLDAYEQIDALLREAAEASGLGEPHGIKLALSSLETANFEKDPQTVDVLDRLTHLLVADGYHVMEKKSSVLARLAFESVIDIREERASGTAPGLVDDPFYRQHLNYGLVTDGSDEQLHYGVRIEGTESRLTQLDRAGGATTTDMDLSDPNQPSEQSSASERSDKSMVALENLPIYMARFDTAEQLLAVRVLAQPELTVIEKASYNTLFDEAESRRSVSLAVRVRLLDRTGRILHTRDFIGDASETLIPKYETRPVVELPVF